MKTVGQKIKDIREDRDMTQEDLAKKIRRNVRSIQYYERDKQLTLDIVKDIAKALDVSPLTFFTSIDDLFRLFIAGYNLEGLSLRESKKLKSEFNSILDDLAIKYKK